MKQKILGAVVAIFFIAVMTSIYLSCSSPYSRCPPTYAFPNQTNYDVKPTFYTPKNIAVDPSGLKINPRLVDRVTDEVEACLYKTFGNPPILPVQVQMLGQCPGASFPMPVKRQCLTVKVASDWFLSETEFAGSKQQLLPAYAGYGDCGKNLSPGPCYWRAGVQDGMTIVTTPSFYVYKEPLLRLTTGCRDPWSSPELSVCMTPTTGALSDGSEE